MTRIQHFPAASSSSPRSPPPAALRSASASSAPPRRRRLSVRPWSDDAIRHAGEINAWVVIEPDDTRDHPLRPRRDGAGQLHHAAANPHRRARMRLGLREAGIRLGQPQSQGEQGLRQPLAPAAAARCASTGDHGAAGRRERARAPDRGGGEALERAGVRMRGGHEQGHAQADRPHVPLRRACRRGGRDQARQGAGDQDARSVQVHRPAARAARRAASRSTARRNTASIWKCPTWCRPRSSPARCSAAR